MFKGKLIKTFSNNLVPMLRDNVYLEFYEDGILYHCINEINSVYFKDVSAVEFGRYRDYLDRRTGADKYKKLRKKYTHITRGIELYDSDGNALMRIAFTDLGLDNVREFLNYLIKFIDNIEIGDDVRDYLTKPKEYSDKYDGPTFGLVDPSGKTGCLLIIIVPLLFILYGVFMIFIKK